MEASYHRHDINDKEWALLESHLPRQRSQWGGIAQDNRRFINAVFGVFYALRDLFIRFFGKEVEALRAFFIEGGLCQC